MNTTQTLPAATYLLAYDTTKKDLAKKAWLEYLIRGAALGELILGGHLSGDARRAQAVQAGKPADPMLSRVLDDVVQSDRPSWKHLLHTHARETLASVEQQLTRDSAISIGPGGSVAAADPAAVESLQDAARTALTGRHDPDGLSEREAALAALAAIVPLPTVLSRKEQRSHAITIDAISDRAAAAHPAFRSLLTQMRRTRGRSFSAGGPVH
jgi:hypothetical protein